MQMLTTSLHAIHGGDLQYLPTMTYALSSSLRASPAAPPTRPQAIFRSPASKNRPSRVPKALFRRLEPKLAPADPARTRRAGGALGRRANRFWRERVAGLP